MTTREVYDTACVFCGAVRDLAVLAFIFSVPALIIIAETY